MAATDLTFLHCAHFPNCKAHVDKYFEGYSTLQYMSRGGVELYFDQQRHELRGGWFWSATPGPRIRFHSIDPPAVWSHRYVAFRGRLVDRWREESLFPI